MIARELWVYAAYRKSQIAERSAPWSSGPCSAPHTTMEHHDESAFYKYFGGRHCVRRESDVFPNTRRPRRDAGKSGDSCHADGTRI